MVLAVALTASGLAVASSAAIVATSRATSIDEPRRSAETAQVSSAEAPPSPFGVDAPELARLGSFSVGIRTLSFVERDQPGLLAMTAGKATIPRRDRKLTVDVWYPAT